MPPQTHMRDKPNTQAPYSLYEALGAVTGLRHCTGCGEGIYTLGEDPEVVPAIGFAIIGCGFCGHAMTFSEGRYRDLTPVEAAIFAATPLFAVFVKNREEFFMAQRMWG